MSDHIETVKRRLFVFIVTNLMNVAN